MGINEQQELASLANTSLARELGTFLRARRESLDPSRLGLPRFGRRRTPGLRREEVAQLAEIGVTWYTWLEQGRPVRTSTKVLNAIATALQCTEAETRHLFLLAGKVEQVSAMTPACEKLSQVSRAILDQLNPLPAVLQNARFDIIGFNQAYSRLQCIDLAQLAPQDRNCIYLAFTNKAWRAARTDWEEDLPRMVATFRAALADHMHDAAWARQLQRMLAGSDEFKELWQRYEVRGIENQLKRFHHPRAGVMSLHQTNWWSAPKNGDRLLVYVPTDEQSKAALQILTQEPDAAISKSIAPRRQKIAQVK
jgi:transcriptional regulator with XRE-family HTH domain